MGEWITQICESGDYGILMLPVSLLLGLLAVVSSGCNLALLGAVAGFAVSHEGKSRLNIFLVCVGFMVATIVSLTVVGALVGSIKSVGYYGKILAGLITVVFGLAAVGVVPFRLPSIGIFKNRTQRSFGGGIIFGLAMGGASAGCTLICCSPLLWIVLGAVAAQGRAVLGALVLMMFAIGFSIPMVAVMLGVSMVKLSEKGARI